MTEDNVNTNIGYAKTNDGEIIKEYPIEVFGDVVLLENITKTVSTDSISDHGVFELNSSKEEHGQLGGWLVVAKGPNVVRVEVGDIVGNPIGNSVTPIQHPLIAHRVKIVNDDGFEVVASKKDLDYVYTMVNQLLIGVRYL